MARPLLTGPVVGPLVRELLLAGLRIRPAPRRRGDRQSFGNGGRAVSEASTSAARIASWAVARRGPWPAQLHDSDHRDVRDQLVRGPPHSASHRGLLGP